MTPAPPAQLLSRLPSPVLITGPAFSGKSRIAQQVLGPLEPATVIGTMALPPSEAPVIHARIAALQATRPGGWTTVETAGDVAAAAQSALSAGNHILIDSLSQWLAARLLKHMNAVDQRQELRLFELLSHDTNELIKVLQQGTAQRIVVVSAEAGAAPAPERFAERMLRMMTGEANCRLAAMARSVIDVRCGIPVVIKQ
jgi:adenosylcobinamide kinase/adenosylcobinamide-phosphate guanylyltransferase